jgi:AbrB family looped-hinge helix DNA binding protein
MEANAIMNKRGMITIPLKYRQKYHLKEGTSFMILELEDGLTLIPLQNEEEFNKDLLPKEKIIELIKSAHKEELELEDH